MKLVKSGFVGRSLILLVVLSMSCSPVWGARQAIDVAQDVLTDVEPLLPEEESALRAFSLTQEALGLGEEATDIWAQEGRRDIEPEGYRQWIDIALRGFASILDALDSAGIPIPAEFRLALVGLEALL